MNRHKAEHERVLATIDDLVTGHCTRMKKDPTEVVDYLRDLASHFNDEAKRVLRETTWDIDVKLTLNWEQLTNICRFSQGDEMEDSDLGILYDVAQQVFNSQVPGE